MKKTNNKNAGISIQCITCKRYKGRGSCEAFGTIPDEIFIDGRDHRVPIRGDNGLQWVEYVAPKAEVIE